MPDDLKNVSRLLVSNQLFPDQVNINFMDWACADPEIFARGDPTLTFFF